MRVGVLGTGMVGLAVGGKLAELGHEVMMGTRDVDALMARTEGPRPGLPSFSEWIAQNPQARVATFAEAAEHAELVVNASAGAPRSRCWRPRARRTWTARS